jgi:ABC-type dipeptide/oligopeptide/nickel transport system permease subunit
MQTTTRSTIPRAEMRPPAPAPAGYWQRRVRALRRNPSAMIGFGGLLLLVLLAAAAPLISPYSPIEQNYDALRQPPSAEYLFGTDDVGRDIFTRVLWGGQQSLTVGVLAVAIAVTGGVVIGLISGYYGGWVDVIIQRLVEVIMAFPAILFLFSIVAVLGPGLNTVMVGVGLAFIPSYARLVRASVMANRGLEYVVASRALGATDRQIMVRHILPNIIAPVIIYATLSLGGAILLTAGLSFLGLGAQPPAPEWGAMLLYGRAQLRQSWWMSFFPGLAIFIAIMCINLLGDGLRDALDPHVS